MCGSKDRLSTTLVVVNWSLLIHPFFNVCNNRLWQVSASYLVLFSLLSIEFLLIEITVSSSFYVVGLLQFLFVPLVHICPLFDTIDYR